MKRTSFQVSGLLAITLALTISSASQVTGIPPYQTFASGPDVINLGNLNVHYSIPIFSRGGRGLPFNYSLAYDGSIWAIDTTNGVWIPNTNWGFQRETSALVGYVTYRYYETTCSGGGSPSVVEHHTFTNYVDAQGTLHPFLINILDNGCTGIVTQQGSGVIADGSGLIVSVTENPSATVTFPSGQTTTPQLVAGGTPSGNGNQTDSNGNQITSSTVSGTTKFFDTQSATVQALTITGTAPSPVSYKYTAPSTALAPVTVTYVTKMVQTAFNCPNISDYGPISNNLVDRITLPDNSYYQFTYEATTQGSNNVTGRIASVRLPTGGTISYAYTGGDTSKGVFCADGSTSGFDRTTPDTPSGQHWNYSRSGVTSPYTTTITSPPDPVTSQANVTKIQFQGLYETQRDAYQGGATGTPLLTTYTCYNGNGVTNPTSCATTSVATPFTRITKFRSLDGGPLAEVDATYDGYGNALTTDAYDFGASTPGQKTAIMYGGTYNSGTNTCATLTNGIVNRPCKVTVTDGSGNLKSKTTYGYDETATQPSGITIQHVGISGSRGNLTSVTKYSSSSTTLTTHFLNYDTGLVYKSQDVNGQWTQYTYGACTGAFLTSVSMPLSLSRSMTWNCTGGVMTSSTDENGKISNINYTTDTQFWRPESTKDPLNNITNLTYASLTQNRGHLDFNGTSPNFNSTVDMTSTLDSLGRSFYSQQRQGPSSSNYDTVQQIYDSFGRPFQSTIPYVATTTNNPAPPQGTPASTINYDAMGRPIQTTNAGGRIVTYEYWRSTMKQTVKPAPTGENTKRKQLQYDGLGRLKYVCEITSDPTWSGTCNTTNPQTGYWTQYVYDNVSPSYNSLTVTQNTQSSPTQTRVYVYDMVGRLTSETNPETGNLAYTYVYDTDGTCGASAGDLVKRMDTKNNVTCYTYDALHRLLSVTYPSGPNSGGTPKKYFVYDNATVNSVTMVNAKSRLAEAYTCTTCPGTKITDLGYSYSARGQVTDVYESTAHSGGYYHLTATYFGHGALNALSGVPGLPTIYYGGNNDTSGLDGKGRYLKVTASSSPNPASSVTYTNSGTTQPIGSLTQVTLGSGDNDAFTYDRNTGQLTQYKFNIGASPQTVKGDLTWNTNGTLSSLVIADPFNSANAQTCTYGYDDLARISSASCGTAWSQTFTPDPFGNLTKNGTITFQPGFDRTKNWFLPVTGFDNNGNLLSDVNHTYGWDAENKLTAIDTLGLTFDALGRMVEQANGAAYTQILYAPMGNKLALMNGQNLTKAFVSLPGGGAAVYGSAGTISYYRHADWLGSSRFASTPGRAMYYDLAYAPYAEKYSPSGTQDLNFTGQNQDTASFLYDFLYREYNPSSSRWIQPDPAGIQAVNPADPQTWNRYSYVANNPLSRVDILGLLKSDATGSYYNTCNGWGDVGCSYFQTQLDASVQNPDFSFAAYSDWSDRQTFGSNYFNLPGRSNPAAEGRALYLGSLPWYKVVNNHLVETFHFWTFWDSEAGTGYLAEVQLDRGTISAAAASNVMAGTSTFDKWATKAKSWNWKALKNYVGCVGQSTMGNMLQGAGVGLIVGVSATAVLTVGMGLAGSSIGPEGTLAGGGLGFSIGVAVTPGLVVTGAVGGAAEGFLWGTVTCSFE
jgi:RHS repeat-associated protein